MVTITTDQGSESLF